MGARKLQGELSDNYYARIFLVPASELWRMPGNYKLVSPHYKYYDWITQSLLIIAMQGSREFKDKIPDTYYGRTPKRVRNSAEGGNRK